MRNQFAIFAIILLFCSCADEPLSRVAEVSGDVMSRALTTPDNGVSESNPDLITNWGSLSQVVLNSGDVVELPWSRNGVSTQLSDYFCQNVQSSNGWVMLMHTFQKVGVSKQQNYMMLYNLFTGVIKVFYYYEGNQLSTDTQWFVYAKPKSGSEHYKFLDVPGYYSLPDSKAAINVNNEVYLTNESVHQDSQTGLPTGLQPGWNGFEFQVARYANDLTDCDFKIGAFNTLISKSDFNGGLKFATSGTITSKTTTAVDNTDKTINSISTFAGNKAEQAVLGLKEANNNKLGGIKIAADIIDLVGDIAKVNIGGIITKGLNLLFGRSTTTNKTYTTNSDVRLNSEGEVTLSGISSIQTLADVPTISFNLKDVVNAQTSSPLIVSSLESPVVVYGGDVAETNTSIGGGLLPGIKGAQLMNLGVWTIKNTPKVYWDLQKPVSVKKISDEGGYALVDCSMSCPTISKYEVDVEINPYISMWVKNHNVSVQFVACKKSENDLDGGYDAPGLSKSNFIFSDSTTQRVLYGLSSSVDCTAWVGTDGSLPTTIEELAKVRQFYMNWEFSTEYRIIAFVTVSMDVDYKKSKFNVTETRVYEVENIMNSDNVKLQLPEIVVFDKNNTWLTNKKFS